MGDGINTNHTLPGGHGVHHHPVEPVLERVIHTGAAVEVHIQHLSREGVFVLGLHDAVATLGEIGTGVLGHHLEGGINLAIVGIHLPPPVGGLILEDQKEPAGQRLAAALLPDEPDGAFSQAAAGFHRFLFQIRLEACYILVGVRLAGHGFELQSHGGYFQPAGESGDDPPLLLVGAEQEVDGLNLQDLDKPAVSGFDDAVFEFFEWNEVLNELQLFFWRGACPSSFSGGCLCACSCHSGIQSSYSEAAAGAPET